MDKYIYSDKRPKEEKRIKLSTAIAIAVICSVVCILATFAICGASGMFGGAFFPRPNDTVLDIVEGLDLPEYIQDIIKLDIAFNDISYSGVDEAAVGEAMLDAYIAATGDMYAEYLNKEEYAAFFEERVGEFVGIGVSIVNSEIDVGGVKQNTLEIISVYKDSPALESGVEVGDCIMYVNNGGELALVDSLGYTKALDVMLGESGSVAHFVVYRPTENGYEEKEFKITRRKVTTESVTHKVSETDSGVGIVSISSFDATTAPQFKASVEELKSLGCTKFVFDVRNNPGGALDAIEAVLSYFLDEGDVIVHTEYGTGAKQTEVVRTKKYEEKYAGFNVYKEDIGIYKELDCIVLTNGNTASAAELFTATLRDYGIAQIVGTKTYGKGCMQNIIPLADYGLEGGLRVTSAMYFSASREVYHDIGILPDFEIDLSAESKKINFFLLPEEKDEQLQKAIEELLK